VARLAGTRAAGSKQWLRLKTFEGYPLFITMQPPHSASCPQGNGAPGGVEPPTNGLGKPGRNWQRDGSFVLYSGSSTTYKSVECAKNRRVNITPCNSRVKSLWFNCLMCSTENFSPGAAGRPGSADPRFGGQVSCSDPKLSIYGTHN
jgi:hypothetical protein